MDRTVELDDGRARIVVRPDRGGVLARYDALIDDRWVPLIVPWQKQSPHFGCQVLAPWSNRVSGGGFTFEGRFHALEPNVPGEPLPIHGDAFQRAWRVISSDDSEVRLTLDGGAIGPYRYRGELSYLLEDGDLAVNLSIHNLASIRLPYGLGFHPWFPRDGRTMLTAPAGYVWLEDDRHLPTALEPLGRNAELDFSVPHSLPEGWMNNAFVGWTREAVIDQGSYGISLRLAASEMLNAAIIFSPSATSGYFCLEPVSHPVDAHHIGGLIPLDPGQSLSASMRMTWQEHGDDW